MITKRQKEALDFINQYQDKKKYAPSLEEIRKHLKLASVSTAHFHVKKLENSGYLKKDDNQPRSIDVFKQEKMVTIPLLGTIAAGQPIEAVQEKETIAIAQNKLPRLGEFYALRVVGDSMIDENINDGDIVLVKQQGIAENGQKVVALIDNHAATLKKYYREHGQIRLQPANKNIEPIIIKKNQEVIIQGIVVDVIKSGQEIVEERVFQQTVRGHVIPEHKRPRGGCELIYPNKLNEESIILETDPANLNLIKRYGNNVNNKLISGDNLNVLKSLYEDNNVRGKVDLIYIDPPFGTGQDFIGYDENRTYSDKLINTEFLEFLRKRLIFLRELLSSNGSIYLHIDQKIGHYVKLIMDEVFGEENFRNDITRIKCNPKNFERKAYGNVKDVVYFYSKSKPNGNDALLWNDYRLPITEEEITRQFSKIDKFGKRYATTPLHAKGETRNGPTGQQWKGLKPPKGRHWRYAPAELTRLDKEGLIEWSTTGNPRKIIYAHENRGKKIQDVWDFKDPGFEKSQYPTEKNIEMLEQIIKASSSEGNLILDCFAGSGTTLVAAQKLNRSWIGIDSNRAAIEVMEKRLLSKSADTDLFAKPVSFEVYRTN